MRFFVGFVDTSDGLAQLYRHPAGFESLPTDSHFRENSLHDAQHLSRLVALHPLNPKPYAEPRSPVFLPGLSRKAKGKAA